MQKFEEAMARLCLMGPQCLVAACLALLSPPGVSLDLTTMLPLAPGSSWRLSADGQEYTLTVIGTGTFEGAPVTVMRNVVSGVTVLEYYLSKNAVGDLYHGSEFESPPFGTSRIVYAPPRLQLPDELDFGQSETQATTISVTNSVFPGVGQVNAITDTITLVGPELVTVPAGSFPAYKFVISSVFNAVLADFPSSSTVWYVPGLGAVKAINVDEEGTETTVLLDFSLAGTDSDGDGIPDDGDAFPNDSGEFADTDGDNIGNNADPDDDNDGISDVAELDCGLNPLLNDAALDSDNDGISNEEECRTGTDPLDDGDPGTSGLNLILIQAIQCDQDDSC
ncbi:MAG: thrombospondin type 3 repeat-containing protein [Pseudomonadota bacterium]